MSAATLSPRLPEAFRPVESAPATSNVAAGESPFQRWYNFKEAFTPRFVEEVISSMPHQVRTCLDPFGGSGTTALTAQILGVRPSTIEVNPFLADLIESKLSTYDVKDLVKDRARVQDACRIAELLGEPPHFQGAPATFIEPGVESRWIFDLEVAKKVCAYRDAISALENKTNKRLLRVLLGSILVPISNVVISGKGRRYRSNWQTRRRSPATIDLLFETAFQGAIYDICRYGRRRCEDFTLLRGDSRSRIVESDPVDLVLFSPPYPNSFDYTDIYNVELWALGYLRNTHDNRQLREGTLRSHVQIKRAAGADAVDSSTLAQAREQLEDVRAELWNPHIPEMIEGYFADLQTVLRGAACKLTPSGQAVLVVGDSKYADVQIDVPQIICEFAPTIGLRCVQRQAVRSMRNSPQQGGELALSESMIRLELL